jgi:DNA mismatch endonuclease (patch repair protein)
MKSKNTSPELIVKKKLSEIGLSYKCHIKNLNGTPDIVIEKYKIIINVKGCFWHNHGCIENKLPTSKIKFWNDKFNSVKISDNENLKKNLAEGWKVIDLWECVIKKEKFLENELKKYLFISNVFN